MKVDHHTETASILEERLDRLYSSLIDYQPGKIKGLSELAQTISMGNEYWTTHKYSSKIKPIHYNNTIDYLEGIYLTQICLVLNKNSKYYSYTRNNIIKSLRGFGFHADHDDKSNRKQKVLRQFVYENNKEQVTYEVALTYDWLIMPGVYSSAGNQDSNGPYRLKWKIEGKPTLLLSVIESVMLHIALEFSEICKNGRYFHKNRLLMHIDDDTLIKKFGLEIAEKIMDLIKWHNQEKNKTT